MGQVDLLRYLMDDAFAGKGLEESNESQSLMANLATVEQSMWRVAPGGGRRTIESISLHVGACKVMYAEYAFRDGRLDWDSREVQPWPDGEAPMDEAMRWLRDAHAALMTHVVALSDEDLAGRRPANWGELCETRWLLSILLQHDVYHAGEVNHIRSLLDGDDRWRWQMNGG